MPPEGEKMVGLHAPVWVLSVDSLMSGFSSIAAELHAVICPRPPADSLSCHSPGGTAILAFTPITIIERNVHNLYGGFRFLIPR